MSSHRYICFWPHDWMNDPALRICSEGARGLWMDIICLAHSGDPYGHLTANGSPMPLEHLAKLCRMNPRTVRKLIGELEKNGVFSRDSKGSIFSRRMVRDEEKSKEQQRLGRMGGNPRLKGGDNQPPNPPDKRYLNGGDKPKYQSQISKSNSNAGAREAPRQECFKNGIDEEERRYRRLDDRQPSSSDPKVAGVVVNLGRQLRNIELARGQKAVRDVDAQLVDLGTDLGIIRPKATAKPQEPIRTVEEQLAALGVSKPGAA